MTATDALPPTGSRVVLSVGGGIAAYKACEVLRGLTEAGHHVRVVATTNDLHADIRLQRSRQETDQKIGILDHIHRQ